MERELLKNILLKLYKRNTVDKIFQGRTRPKYDVMFKLNKEHNIPFTAWKDIKSYISNSTVKNKEV